MIKDRIYVLVGPTASGKTAAAIGIAKLINARLGRTAEIVSADSIQIYKDLDVGSAKPSLEEMQGIRHHMLDFVDHREPGYNVAVYREQALAVIRDIIARGNIPFVVGGTGLYINSIVFPLNFSEAVPDFERREVLSETESQYPGTLHRMLTEIDPVTAARLHPNDTKRLIRAIEVFERTGTTLSEAGGDFTNERGNEIEFEPIMAGLNMERKLLYERIEHRVDLMMEAGLIDEVKRILSSDPDRSLPALQGLGYKQLIMYLDGKCTLNEAVYLIKRDTRRFAKRLISWFRRDKRIRWFETDKCSPEVLENDIFSYYFDSEGK